MGAFSERGTLSRSSKRLLSCTSFKKSCSSKKFTTNRSPAVSTRSFGSLLKAPMGSAATTSLASPIKGGCPKRSKKRNYTLPRNNVGSGNPIPLTVPLPCGAKGVHGELGFRVVSADPVSCWSVVGKGLGKPTIRLHVPLTRSDPYLLHTNHEGMVGH